MRSFFQLFLIKSTVPLIDELKELLDVQLGEMATYNVGSFNYMGSSKAFEDERITEDIRDSMPAWAKATGLPHLLTEWRSEREWIELIMTEPEEVQKFWLDLEVNETNIDRLEAMPARAIYEELETEARLKYAAMPSLKELCLQVAGLTNRKVYRCKSDVDALWQDQAAALSIMSM